MRQEITLTVPSSTEFLHVVGAVMSEMAALAGFDDRQRRRIELAVDEACSNVLLCAYQQESEQSYRIGCVKEASELRITITDWGQDYAFPAAGELSLPAKLPDPSSANIGLYLIYQIMDEVTFVSQTQQHVLSMRKLLHPSDARP
ncbi:MAG: ATP-binding protein [Candidatus Tectomicrobia bacterium]|nr:ATP-binding protein [Candidatus Tectomicrobia bacterium]